MNYGNYIRTAPPRPPEKGSFPLDHFKECTALSKQVLNCLKDNDNIAARCRPLMKQYLECRMDKGLMAQEDIKDLGFKETDRTDVEYKPKIDLEKEKQGFVAGLGSKKRRSMAAAANDSSGDKE